ncbi:hypothetical protein BEWA_015940 [Theileria equi strain WA]|uniref:Uncharacterized protein n=1 Tax=Theileria equi strain WA TaxID=1537102 RepID=L1LCY1_THEEQ|nr:hypothetical protein BEWA_015940 [Theileria equi strain WA]EKX73033.1 hypothetical protein BEWA_015940 [Theileria equi strain WA]|eukprot:XP_004832485.1 hypothetical protein BEWA_015940 [Theileria equi strain WA]
MGVIIDIGYDPKTSIDTKNRNYIKYEYSKNGKGSVEVTEHRNIDTLPGYKKCVHKPKHGAQIGEVFRGEVRQNGLEKSYDSDSITVYFWELDRKYMSPLLLQLGDEYYKTYDA